MIQETIGAFRIPWGYCLVTSEYFNAHDSYLSPSISDFNVRRPSFSGCRLASLEQSATPRHVCTVTACFPQSSEDSSLQPQFSLTILLCPRSGRHYGHVNRCFYLLTYLLTYLLIYFFRPIGTKNTQLPVGRILSISYRSYWSSACWLCRQPESACDSDVG